MNDSESRPLRLGWGRFALIAAILAAIFGSISVFGARATPAGRALLTPMAFVCASLLGFSAYRWHRLRKAVLSGELKQSEVRRDFQGHFLGPRRPRILWVALTTVAFVVLVVLSG